MADAPTQDPRPRLQAEVDALRLALDRLSSGTPLPEFLAELCLGLERMLGDGHCTVLLLDADGLHVRHGAGPTMPEAYLALIDGLPIGPQAGSCGTAMYRRARVVVEDIATDPLWEPYREAARPFGLAACASLPLLDAQGAPLGAFALYHSEPGPFPEADLALLEQFTEAAALAIRIAKREERLRGEELRHRALVEQAGDGIFYFNAESGRILETNRAFREMLGYAPGDLERLTIFELAAHEPESVRANIRRVVAAGAHTIGERNYRHKDGTLVAVEVSAAPLKLGDQTVFSVIARDIRARNASQEALRHSEAQLKEAQRLGRLGNWRFDLPTGSITWSEEVYRIFDRDPELGPPSYEAYLAALHPEDRPAHIARVERAMAGEADLGFDLRTVDREGRIHWHHGQVHPLREGEQVVGLYGVAQDVTEQKEAEAQLRALVSNLKGIMEQASDGIFVADATTTYVDANPQALEMVGYSLDELRSLRILDLLPPEEREQLPARLQAVKTRRPYLAERTLLRKDGSRFIAEISAKQLEDGRYLSIARDVTERRAAEERQRQTAQELGEAQALGRIGSWTLEVATGEVRWSDTLYTILGRDPALGPLSPEVGAKVFDPEGTGAYRTTLDRLLREGGEAHSDLRVRLEGGETRIFHSFIRAIRKEDRVTALKGVLQDVTESHLAREALADSEARFRIIVEQTGQLVYDLDLARETITWDGAIRDLTGHEPETFRKVDLAAWTALIHPEDRERALAELNDAMGHLRAYHATYRFQRRDGSYFPAEDRGVFLAGPDGKAARMLGTMSDASIREEARLVQERSERSFRHLFDLNPAPMVLSRPMDGTILLANRAAYRMFRLTPEEVERKRTVDFFADPQDRARLLAELAKGGHVEDFALELQVHGSRRQVLLSAGMPEYLGQKAILVALTDITDRAREEEQQRQSQKLESLGLLAGGIAHDFNNLLTSLLGNLGLAQLHVPASNAATPYLADMEQVIQRAADLARQMLAYSGKGRFRLEAVNLHEVVREITHLLSVGIPKRIQLNLELEADLPWVMGDPVQLQQVVMNLVTNAAEAIGDQNGFIRLRTEHRALDAEARRGLLVGKGLEAGRYLCLEVEDSGGGMTPEVVARIFDPFFTTKSTGRGLGLSALLGILNGHRAGLTIETEPGRGTTFCVWFQLLEGATPTAQAPDGTAQPTRYRGRVLVVDDERSIRSSATALLQHLGFDVVEAADGQEGLDHLQACDGAFDLVLLDLTMPRMDGREALGHMRARWPHLPVILSSGYSEQAGSLDLGGPGAYLPKPYRVVDLREALARALGR